MTLALVSIGRPDVGLALCEHLGVGDGADWVYADPDNALHDAMATNRGWDTMVRPATALRFRDRIFGEKGGGGGSLDQVRAGEAVGDAPAIGRSNAPIGVRLRISSHDFSVSRCAIPSLDAAVRSPGQVEQR